MASATRIARASLAIVIATIATVLYLRTSPATPTEDLIDRIIALENQVQGLTRTSAAKQINWTLHRDASATSATPEAGAAIRTQKEETTSRSASDPILTRAGVSTHSSDSHELQRVAASASDVTQRLLGDFHSHALADHAFTTHAGCEGSSCTIEVTFNDTRSAIEHETALTQWLSEADGNCGFTLLPLALDSLDGHEAVPRRVSFDCG